MRVFVAFEAYLHCIFVSYIRFGWHYLVLNFLGRIVTPLPVACMYVIICVLPVVKSKATFAWSWPTYLRIARGDVKHLGWISLILVWSPFASAQACYILHTTAERLIFAPVSPPNCGQHARNLYYCFSGGAGRLKEKRKSTAKLRT